MDTPRCEQLPHHGADKELRLSVHASIPGQLLKNGISFVHACFMFDFFIGTCGITQPLQNVTVFENASAVFNCRFEDCDWLMWMVNDELIAYNTIIIEDCVWSRQDYTSSDTSHLLIVEEAKKSCNNSTVTCVTGVINGTGDDLTPIKKDSSSAKLLIQG